MEIVIAAKDTDLFLGATVVRKAATVAYVNVNFHLDNVPGWKPHTSHRSSGLHHQKSFDPPFRIQKKPPSSGRV